MCCNGVINIRGNDNYRCCETVSFDRSVARCNGGVIEYEDGYTPPTVPTTTTVSLKTTTTPIPMSSTTWDPNLPLPGIVNHPQPSVTMGWLKNY